MKRRLKKAFYNIAVLDPKGLVALHESALIKTALLLMLAIAVPILIFAYFTAWKYRAENKKAKYDPELAYNAKLAFVWWLFPAVIVIMLAAITWKTAHELDPWKPLDSDVKPLTIQVVALQWKWLFIYPEQNIATVNFIQFPVGTPLNFELTADAPMNSFWIPELGGQMYAMAGMSTKLHLIADEPGNFTGRAAEINGKGFSGMTFTARASSQGDFDRWVESIKNSSGTLSLAEYNNLAAPSEYVAPEYFSSANAGLYDNIVMKFIMPEMK